MNIRRLSVWAVLFIICYAVNAAVRVTGLTTLYQQNPLGIDEKPLFSWRLEATAEERSVSQQAYQIVVATSEQDLTEGRYTYDTGRVADNRSVQMAYKGELKPRTRYYWKVRVWNQDNNISSYSEVSWFETGLLVSSSFGWGGASWISSSKMLLSPFRSSYVIDYDVRIAPESNRSVFVFGKRDESHYNLVELNRHHLILSHRNGDLVKEDACEDVSCIIYGGDSLQHISLSVFASQYCKAYKIDIKVNGKDIKNTHIDASMRPKTLLEIALAGKQAEFTIDPNDGQLGYNARLYEVGFYQPEGEKATFSDITIKSPSWGTTLYHDTIFHTIVNELVSWQPGAEASAPMLRKEFKVRKPVKSARLYASARGIYECYINGRRVGEDFLNPGWPDYRFRMYYNTFDVTGYLQTGDNAIGATLGNGWWSDFMGYQTYWQDQYGVGLSFISRLEISYIDGSTETIVTDDDWSCFNEGPVTGNSLQNGENYDARKEPMGWTLPGFDDSLWQKVVVDENIPSTMTAYVGEPVRCRETRTAQTVTQPEQGKYIYDMGVNMVGIPSIRLTGRPGQKITLRYAEMLWPDQIPTSPVAPYTTEMYQANQGHIYTDNYRSALSVDTYICKGGEETIEPRFTQHGYRYVQIEGLDEPLPLSQVQGLVMHSMDGPQTSSFETSDALVNQLYRNIVWGQKGNFLAVPTDCPQRDERLGYTGDGQIFARSAMYNYQVEPFFRRWMYSVRDDQDEKGDFADFSPKVDTPPAGTNGGGVIGWSDAGIIVPWNMYLQYADRSILAESYPSMKRYMDYLERQAEGYLQPAGGLGDWLGFEETNSQITNTSFYAYDATLMAKIARILGHEVDARHYVALFDSIKSQFNRTFVMADGRTFTPAGYKKGKWFPKQIDRDEIEDTQTSYVLPLKAGLFDNPERATDLLCQAIDRQNGHLSTGFIATPYLNTALSDNGRSDVAYQLFLNQTYPSWLYPVTQGATTIWERWNSYTIDQGFGPVDMNSFNHYSYGAVEEWMMQYVLGIRADEQQPGYKHFILEPHPCPHLDYARGHYDSVYGRIACKWTKEEKGYLYEFDIPANTTATVMANGQKSEFKSGRHHLLIKDKTK